MDKGHRTRWEQIKHLKAGDCVVVMKGEYKGKIVRLISNCIQPCMLGQLEENGKTESISIVASELMPSDQIYIPTVREFCQDRILTIEGRSVYNVTFNQALVTHLRTFTGLKLVDIHAPSENIWYVVNTKYLHIKSSDFSDGMRVAYDGASKWLALVNEDFNSLHGPLDMIIHEPTIELSVLDKELLDHAVVQFWKKDSSPSPVQQSYATA